MFGSLSESEIKFMHRELLTDNLDIQIGVPKSNRNGALIMRLKINKTTNSLY